MNKETAIIVIVNEFITGDVPVSFSISVKKSVTFTILKKNTITIYVF